MRRSKHVFPTCCLTIGITQTESVITTYRRSSVWVKRKRSISIDNGSLIVCCFDLVGVESDYGHFKDMVQCNESVCMGG